MSTKKLSVMVIEDEPLLLRAIGKKLELTGLDVVSCTSGKQAVDYLGNLPELPDAIWLDYYLPDMNGLEFMTKVKASPKWAAIPVLVVSNSAGPNKVQSMLALGVKKYILKAEYRLEEIVDIVQELMEEKQKSKTHE